MGSQAMAQRQPRHHVGQEYPMTLITGTGCDGDLFGLTALPPHGSLLAQWPETRSGARGLGLVSGSQGLYSRG